MTTLEVPTLVPETSTHDDRLDSWKEIAAYLKRNERTVSRWEKRGLPIYRVPGAQRQMVFAYKHELDEWLHRGQKAVEKSEPLVSKQEDETQRAPTTAVAMAPKDRVGWKRLILFTAIGAVAVLGYWLIFLHRPRADSIPTRIDFTGNVMQVFDERNRLIWTHSFSKTLDLDWFQRTRMIQLARIGDLEGNGEKEVLVAVPLRAEPNPGDDVIELDYFSSRGKLLWSYIPDKTFRFGSYELGGPWHPFDIFVSSNGSTHVVWVTFSHHEWGNSFVVQLDPATGKDTVRFVNTGIIYALNEITTSKGSYLLAGGFNNEYAAGSLAVIDESRLFAVSPQTEGTRHKCLSCPEGAPDYYFVFPRSELNRLSNLWEDSVRSVKVSRDEVEISKAELQSGGTEAQNPARAIYLFHTEPTIRPFAFRFDSGYDMLHRKLEKEKKLEHTLESCPERLHPEPVRVWTPVMGWTDVRLNPARAVD